MIVKLMPRFDESSLIQLLHKQEIFLVEGEWYKYNNSDYHYYFAFHDKLNDRSTWIEAQKHWHLVQKEFATSTCRWNAKRYNGVYVNYVS